MINEPFPDYLSLMNVLLKGNNFDRWEVGKIFVGSWIGPQNKAVLNLAAIVVDERPQEKIFAAAVIVELAVGQF